MKTLATNLFLILLPIWVCPAFGHHPNFSEGQEKPTSHIRANEAWDSKDGGETIESAIEIVLPFSDTGATCDNIDDYDVACPYSGSTSPDVVYTFLASSESNVRIDLCGSSYDTKVYLYDEDLNVIACNDDFYSGPPCGSYVSLLELVPVQAGSRYYVVVDGYGGDCGEYFLTVENDCLPPPCLDAVCPGYGVAENEPPLNDGYQDAFNSGCDNPEPVFQELLMQPGQDELIFCGNTGYYTTGGELHRDSDWFVMVASGNNIHLETNSSHFLPTDCDVMYLNGCDNVSLLHYQMGVCDAGIIDIPTYPGEVLFLRVRPTHAARPECAHREDLYTLKIQGIWETVVATEDVSWGSLKSWFRQ